MEVLNLSDIQNNQMLLSLMVSTFVIAGFRIRSWEAILNQYPERSDTDEYLNVVKSVAFLTIICFLVLVLRIVPSEWVLVVFGVGVLFFVFCCIMSLGVNTVIGKILKEFNKFIEDIYSNW